MRILDQIKANKLEEVERAKSDAPLESLRESAAGMPPPRGFARAIRGGRDPNAPRVPDGPVQVIAEVKKASPSVGVIREDFDPAAIARSYATGGAAAISCLTDGKFFQGSLDDLRQVRRAVELPLLRKEFMLDPYQVWEARAVGADAILLIAGFVDGEQLAAIRQEARSAGLDVLVEIHHASELASALDLEPDVLGINNRDLRTQDFHTDLATTLDLAATVPPTQTLISESGIRASEDVERLASVGVDGILVGEHLMRQAEPGAAIGDQMGVMRGFRV